ncbi:transcriptional regulator [Microbulbifer thermotolerans]|uniref:transcriptional regulator n=1 Tax=Microbulbifer thermotolerans TaxID=252514 RepID=UPI003461C76B
MEHVMDSVYKRLVSHFRTQEETARALGVDQSTVSGWVRGVHRMSPAVAVRAERATGGAFTRQEMCPGFPWDSAA